MYSLLMRVRILSSPIIHHLRRKLGIKRERHFMASCLVTVVTLCLCLMEKCGFKCDFEKLRRKLFKVLIKLSYTIKQPWYIFNSHKKNQVII